MNTICYIADRDVDAALDAELCALLSTCFTGPNNARLKTQRFYAEMPQHRWLIRAPGKVIAHLAVHDKRIGSTAGELPIGGVAEVAVHPEFRGRGFARQLLATADDWMQTQGMAFGFLFGKPEVYGSSGYASIGNPIRQFQPAQNVWVTAPCAHALVKQLGAAQWPDGLIDLRGPTF